MKIALGRYQNGTVKLSSLQNGSKTIPSEANGVVASALDCHIHAIPTKLSADQQIRTFCEHYIKTIHPGPYNNLELDYLPVGKGKDRKIILVIMEREILDAYLELKMPLYFFFQLDFMGTPGVSFCCHTGDFYEHYIFEDQAFRNVEISQTKAQGILILPHPEAAYKINRIRNKRLFYEKNPKKLRTVLLLAFLAAVLLFLCYRGLLSFSEYNQLKSLNQQKQDHLRKLAAQKADPNAIAEEEAELLQLGNLIYDAKPVDYYSLLSLISNSLRNRVSIKSLKITEQSATINGTTRSALQLVEDLKSTGAFSGLTPSRISPTEDGEEEFSLTGVFNEDFR